MNTLVTSADEAVGQQDECLHVVRVVAQQLAAQPDGVTRAEAAGGSVHVHRIARRAAESGARGPRGIRPAGGGGLRALDALEANDVRVDARRVHDVRVRRGHHRQHVRSVALETLEDRAREAFSLYEN